MMSDQEESYFKEEDFFCRFSLLNGYDISNEGNDASYSGSPARRILDVFHPDRL